MSHQLIRLRDKVYNTPQLMSLVSFENICDYLDARCSKDFKLEEGDSERHEVTDRYSFNSDIGVAVMNLQGPLTDKPVTMMGFDCGGTSYQQLKEDFTYLADSGAKTIAFMTDSGGGEAYGVFDAANYIRSYADTKGVKILSYIDGLSASAAYALTAISDEIITNSQSELGSIGVVVRLMNDSKALEKDGYERTFITAGADKVPFANDGSFKPEFLADIQTKVDTLYESFTEFVASNRNMSVEAVRATEAKTFLSGDALKLGLADKVMTLEGFYEYLADTAQSHKGDEKSMLKDKLFKMNKEGQSFDMNELELAKSELSELGTKYEAQAADLQLALAGVQDLQAKLAEAQGVVAEFKAAQDKAELEAKEAVAATRKAALVASIGEDQAAALSASLEGVSDAQYEAVVAAVTKANAALVENPLFKEMGADVEVETNPDMEDALAKLIQKTYKTK